MAENRLRLRVSGLGFRRLELRGLRLKLGLALPEALRGKETCTTLTVWKSRFALVRLFPKSCTESQLALRVKLDNNHTLAQNLCYN